MNAIAALYSSTIGKKTVMAVTGGLMVAWLFAHMLGNLQVFLGAEWLDAYGHKLQTSGPIIWGTRGVMLACILAHIWAIMGLIGQSGVTRKTGYEGGRVDFATNVLAKAMKVGGLILLVFIPIHLLDLTIGTTHPTFEHGKVYHNLTSLLSNPLRAQFYLLAAIAAGAHVIHGTQSMFQTLGLNHDGYNATWKFLAGLIGGSVLVGNMVIVGAIALGFVK